MNAKKPPDYVELLRRQLGSVKTVTASEAKNQFGQVLDAALTEGPVVITKHDAPKAVLLSMKELQAITEYKSTARRLDALSVKLEEMYAEMQTPRHKAAVRALFDATPEELGAAAVEAARKKR